MRSRTSRATIASPTPSGCAAADSLAATLAERGVGPGDVVALYLGSSIDFAVGYAAASRLGAVATGINTRLGPTEITAILAKCEPAVLIHESPGDPLPAGVARPAVVLCTRRDAARRRRGQAVHPARLGPSRGPRVHRVDERDHRHAEGRVVRPSRAAGVGRDERHPQRAVRPPVDADPVRARRLHEQAVGPARVRHHVRAPARCLVGRGVARPHGEGAHHRRPGRAHAMGEAGRPARAGGRRPLGVAARVHRLGAGVARAGREDADAASGVRSSSATRAPSRRR